MNPANIRFRSLINKSVYIQSESTLCALMRRLLMLFAFFRCCFFLSLLFVPRGLLFDDDNNSQSLAMCVLHVFRDLPLMSIIARWKMRLIFYLRIFLLPSHTSSSLVSHHLHVSVCRCMCCCWWWCHSPGFAQIHILRQMFRYFFFTRSSSCLYSVIVAISA